MYSLSTSWNLKQLLNNEAVFLEIKKAGIKKLELGFSIPSSKISLLLNKCKEYNLKISSVHNFCPVPKGYDALKFFPDTYSLSSPIEAERKKAVKLTIKSLHTTKSVNAKALIIHAGRVEIADHTKKLRTLYDQGKRKSKEYKKLHDYIKVKREKNKKPFLVAIKKSLRELLEMATKLKLKLCIENRYYHREIPSFEEVALFLDSFRNFKNFGYWHDVGHAQVSENLGFTKHNNYLDSFKDKIVGFHLHDVIGSKDHMLPGMGDFDFSILKSFVKKNTIKVLEIHPPADINNLKKSILYLKEVLG